MTQNSDAYRLLSGALFNRINVDIKTPDRTLRIAANPPPEYSLSVHPAQLYSAAHAGALAFLLWVFYPVRRRDGQVLALLMTLYPVGRFLLECVRADEPGRLGTSLTVSQWISIFMLAAAAGLWVYLRRNPTRLALPAEGTGETQ